MSLPSLSRLRLEFFSYSGLFLFQRSLCLNNRKDDTFTFYGLRIYVLRELKCFVIQDILLDVIGHKAFFLFYSKKVYDRGATGFHGDIHKKKDLDRKTFLYFILLS